MSTELSVSIPYKPLSRVFTQTSICIWAVIGFALLAGGLAYWHVLTAGFGWWSTVMGVFAIFGGGFLYLYVPFQLGMSYVEGNRLIGNKDGLIVPASLLGFGSQRTLNWQEIALIDFVPASGSVTAGRLSLKLKDRSAIRIDTDCISDEDLQRLYLACEVWASDAAWTQAAEIAREALSDLSRGIAGPSFTRVWEEELNRRFTATTFVPHPPGAVLRGGEFTIIRQIAFGGFSAVYLAENRQHEKSVLKECVFSSGDKDSAAEKAIQLFDREAQILARLNHPRIAAVRDQFVEQGRTYLVLEYVEGENLRELVRLAGKQDEGRIWIWAREMAELLDYLHSQEPPVIHRDFTPDNLVLSSDGHLTLIDFGASNEYASRATGTLIGKQSYMPPEQLRGKAEPRSDLYALGCTLYFLAAGVDPEALTSSILKDRSGSVSALGRVVEALTEQDAASRPASARDLLKMLHEHE